MSLIGNTDTGGAKNSLTVQNSNEFTLDHGLHWHQAGSIERAETIYRGLLSFDNRNADAFHLLGLACLSKGSHKEALNHIQQAIRINSEVPEYYSSLGNIYFDNGDFHQAEAMYVLSLEKDNSYAEGHFNLANTKFAMNDLAGAINEYLEAIKINPTNQHFYFNLANTFFALKDFPSAINNYKKSLSIDPLYSDALFNLGNTYAELMQMIQLYFILTKSLN